LKKSVEVAAQTFLSRFFPQCHVALLGGSAAREEMTEDSDLDIVIIDETQASSFRQCHVCLEWKIEAFVYNRTSLFFAFERCRLEGYPSILRMCAEAIVIKDDGSAADIIQEAKEMIQYGPSEWSQEESDDIRFRITDLLDDLHSSSDYHEQMFTACKLFDIVSEFVLRVNGCWLGDGKWMHRALLRYDSDFCQQYVETFQTFVKTGNVEPLSAFIDDVLAGHGGRLFEGYTEQFI
jgi:hypothetical protein